MPLEVATSRSTAARFSPGAICLSSSSHFPLMPNSNRVNPVALPPGRARLATKPAPTGSLTFTNTMGTWRVACSSGVSGEFPLTTMTSGASATSSAARPAQKFAVARTDAVLDPNVAPDDPSQLLQTLTKGCQASLPFRIVRGPRAEHPDAPHALALLRPRRQRPRRRAAEQRDELAALLIRSPRRRSASSLSGISRPSALAVLRLITSSNFVGSITGRSPGFSPLRMRPA